MIIRQKRRPRHLHRHLKARGVRGEVAARTAFSQRGTWHKSFTSALHQAYPNAWFEKRVHTLWSEWQRKHPGPFTASDGQLLLFAQEMAL